MNYYQLLGININATHEEITRAYRKEIFKNHPDRNPGKENEKLQISILLNEAYEVLSNEERKREYDKNVLSTDLKKELQEKLKKELKEKKERDLEHLRNRMKEHSLKFENNYYSDLRFDNHYKIKISREIKQIIEEQLKIDTSSRLIDLSIATTDNYEFILFFPCSMYKRKYCIGLNFFNSKSLYVLMIERQEHDLLFKSRKTYHVSLYFNGKNIMYSDNILDKYIKCIIHYN